MSEPRTAERRFVITPVELRWQDASGQTVSHPALLVDRSSSGAGIESALAIQTGTSLSIKERTRTLTGTVRYCRQSGDEFIVGVKYDETDLFWARPSAATLALISTH
jgi:hypothetical protein